jgi:hypothetical protein
LVKTWKDCNFAGGGTGILFMQGGSTFVQGGVFIQNGLFSATPLKLSHIKISQWEDRGEPESIMPATNADAIHFINHDRAAGKIESIENGKARLTLAGTTLDIPLERVTQMLFSQAEAPSEPPGPWRVRAHFPGGGSISFQLETWDDKAVTGRSAIFGPLAFQRAAIREVEFNLNLPREETVIANNKDFEELDE